MANNNPFAYVNPNAATEVKTPLSTWAKIFNVMQYFVYGAAVLIVLYIFFIIPTEVSGKSMFPNFEDKQILLSNHLIALIGGQNGLIKDYDYQRGDVVVFGRPNEPDLIKRVIGLPGDRVEIKDNSVFINGEKLIESYIDNTIRPTEPGTFLSAESEQIVPQGSYVLLGDNRTNSLDSRAAEVGFVKRSQIKGAPFIHLFPLTTFGFITRPVYPVTPSET